MFPKIMRLVNGDETFNGKTESKLTKQGQNKLKKQV